MMRSQLKILCSWPETAQVAWQTSTTWELCGWWHQQHPAEMGHLLGAGLCHGPSPCWAEDGKSGSGARTCCVTQTCSWPCKAAGWQQHLCTAPGRQVNEQNGVTLWVCGFLLLLGKYRLQPPCMERYKGLEKTWIIANVDALFQGTLAYLKNFCLPHHSYLPFQPLPPPWEWMIGWETAHNCNSEVGSTKQCKQSKCSHRNA